jgi:excisionase family DNA binding protein
MTKYINVQQAADFLNVTPKYVYTLTQQRKIPYYKPFGKMILFKTEELHDIIEKSKIT